MLQFPPFGGALDVGRAQPCASHTAQFPPFGGGEVAVRGGEVAVRGGVVPNVQTTSAKNADKGCRGRGGLRCWHNSARPGGSLAREPAIACANRLYRTSTRYSVSGRGCPRSHQRVNVRISGPTLALAGPGADQRAHVRGVGPACVRAHILGAVAHAIRLGECSTVSTNVAIPTMRMHGVIQGRGNCMRHSSIADPTGVMRCRRRRSWWRRQWSSRWRTGGMAWWALSALANCPLTLNVHTWLRVRPRIGRVGVFMPPMKQFP